MIGQSAQPLQLMTIVVHRRSYNGKPQHSLLTMVKTCNRMLHKFAVGLLKQFTFVLIRF